MVAEVLELESALESEGHREGWDCQDCSPMKMYSRLRSRRSVPVTISHNRKTFSELLVA